MKLKMDYKTLSLVFFLSIELLFIAVLTITNTKALPNETHKFDINFKYNDVYVDVVNINDKLAPLESKSYKILVSNDGSIDAVYDSLKVIGDKKSLEISVDNLNNELYKNKSNEITLVIKNKEEQEKQCDIGVSFLYKELN